MCVCLYLERLMGKAQHTQNSIRMSWLRRVSGGFWIATESAPAHVPWLLPFLTLCPSLLEWLMMVSHMEGEDLCVWFWHWN